MTFARSTVRTLAETRNHLFREDDYIDTDDALNYIEDLENALRVFARMDVKAEADRIRPPACTECGEREDDLYKGLCGSCLHDARRSGWEG